jgi:DNA repair exonuclease SbcCD nuclease subunit
MSKYIILGDVHLGKGLSLGKKIDGLNSRIQDQIELLNWTLSQAKIHNVTELILTGDIYEHSKPHPGLIRMFMGWLKDCEKNNINVHIIEGNHDIIRTGSIFQSALDIIPAVEFPHVRVYKNFTNVVLNDVHFTFLPYRDRRLYDAASMEDALKMIKNELNVVTENIKQNNMIRIAVGHLALKGSLYVGDEIDDFANEIFCPLDMFNLFDYVWMGHIHKPQVLLNNDKKYIAHIGSMDKSDFGKAETDHDKVIVLLDTDNYDFFTHIQIPTRSLHKISISVPPEKDTTDYVINFLHKFDKDKPIKDAIVSVDITLNGNSVPNVNRDKILQYLYDSCGAYNIVKIVESRNILNETLSENDVIFNTNMDLSIATNIYFDSLKDIADDIKSEAREMALNKITEFKRNN